MCGHQTRNKMSEGWGCLRMEAPSLRGDQAGAFPGALVQDGEGALATPSTPARVAQCQPDARCAEGPIATMGNGTKKCGEQYLVNTG